MSRHTPRRRHPKLAILIRRKVQRHHAENGVLLAIQPDAAANDPAIGREVALPHAVPKHHNVIVTGLSIARLKAASEDRIYSEQRKKIRCSHRPPNTLGTISAR